MPTITFKFPKTNTFSQPFPISDPVLGLTEHFLSKLKLNPKHKDDKAKEIAYTATLPPFITEKSFNDYILITSTTLTEYEETNPFTSGNDLLSLLLTSEYFNNSSISIQIMTSIVNNNYSLLKDYNDVLLPLLSISYKKLMHCSRINVQCDNVWFELFYICLEKVGCNIGIMVKCFKSIIEKNFNADVVEEIITKTFEWLTLGNFWLVQGDSTSSASNKGKGELSNSNNYNAIGANGEQHNSGCSNVQSVSGCSIECENEATSNHINPQTPNNDECSNANNSTNTNTATNNNTHVNNATPHEHKNNTTNTSNNCISLQTIETLITHLQSFRNVSSFYELLNAEYKNINQTIKENVSLTPSPTFQIRIPPHIDNYYEEYALDLKLNNKQLSFVLLYKEIDDTFYINIKINEDTLSIAKTPLSPEKKNFAQIFTFYTYVQVNHHLQETVDYISNDKNIYNIFKLSNFKEVAKKEQHVLVVKINFKLCFVHSVLCSYLLRQFKPMSRDPNIKLLPKNLFLLVIRNYKLDVSDNTDNDVLMSLINWLHDALNVKDDINDVISIINWERVSTSVLFEFVIKYINVIISEQKKQYITELITNSIKAKTPSEILTLLFQVGQNVSYHSLMSKLFKKNIFDYMKSIDHIKTNNSSVDTNANTNTNKPPSDQHNPSAHNNNDSNSELKRTHSNDDKKSVKSTNNSKPSTTSNSNKAFQLAINNANQNINHKRSFTKTPIRQKNSTFAKTSTNSPTTKPHDPFNQNFLLVRNKHGTPKHTHKQIDLKEMNRRIAPKKITRITDNKKKKISTFSSNVLIEIQSKKFMPKVGKNVVSQTPLLESQNRIASPTMGHLDKSAFKLFGWNKVSSTKKMSKIPMNNVKLHNADDTPDLSEQNGMHYDRDEDDFDYVERRGMNSGYSGFSDNSSYKQVLRNK